MRAMLLFAVFAVAVPDRPDPTPKQPNDQLVGEWVNRNHSASGRVEKTFASAFLRSD